jgi:hypothetical protein
MLYLHVDQLQILSSWTEENVYCLLQISTLLMFSLTLGLAHLPGSWYILGLRYQTTGPQNSSGLHPVYTWVISPQTMRWQQFLSPRLGLIPKVMPSPRYFILIPPAYIKCGPGYYYSYCYYYAPHCSNPYFWSIYSWILMWPLRFFTISFTVCSWAANKKT